jgi:hypothetical protein
MTLPANHIHISEREPDGSWEDCTWDSGLEWYRLVYDASVPATHTEAQKLRAASGEPATGGSNLGDLAKGIKARYGKTVPARISGIAALKLALTPGKVAVIQGSMSAFGPTHRLSYYDRNFDGAHAVLLINLAGILKWCDPEAPTNANVPVTVSWAEVAQFVTAFAGQHLVGTIKTTPIKEPDMDPLLTYLPGYTADVKSGSNVRLTPRILGTKVHATTSPLPVGLIGTVKGDVDPGNGSDVWYAFWHDGRVEYTAKDNVVTIKAPVVAAPAPTYPDLSKDLADTQAALKLAAAKAIKYDAIKAALT